MVQNCSRFSATRVGLAVLGGGEAGISWVPSLAAREQMPSPAWHFCTREKRGTLLIFQPYYE